MMYSVDRMTLSSTISLIAQEFGLSSTISGVLLSSFFYGFIAFLFISGIVSDRLTGKPVLIFGLVTFSLATAFTGFASGLTSLIVFRIITGIGEGFFWPAASLEVANATSEKQRTTVMSLYWTGYPIGGFLGTWLGATLGSSYGWRPVFFVAGGLGLVIALCYALMVRPAPKKVEPLAPTAAKVGLATLFANRGVVLMALYYFVLLSGWWIVLLWAPSFLMKVKHLPIGMAGTIAGLLGLAGALGGVLIGRYCDKGDFTRKRTALIGVTLVSGVAMAALAIDLPMTGVVLVVLLLGFIGYPVTPMVLSFTSELVPPVQRGAALGFVTNVGMIAGGISPVLAGYFAQSSSMETVWVAAAIVMATSSVLLLPVRKQAAAVVGEPVVA
jgi:MFS family permease